jgi:hypothetical protein
VGELGVNEAEVRGEAGENVTGPSQIYSVTEYLEISTETTTLIACLLSLLIVTTEHEGRHLFQHDLDPYRHDFSLDSKGIGDALMRGDCESDLVQRATHNSSPTNRHFVLHGRDP